MQCLNFVCEISDIDSSFMISMNQTQTGYQCTAKSIRTMPSTQKEVLRIKQKILHSMKADVA